MRAKRIPYGSIVFDLKLAHELYSEFFGNPLGMRKVPRKHRFNRPLFLNVYETLYLSERRGLLVEKDGKEYAYPDVLQLYDFDERVYSVYRYLRDKGYVLRAGAKFGADFLVYEKGPGEEHAPYVVIVSRDKVSGLHLIRVSRLSNSVRKFPLLATVDESGIKLFRIRWFKLMKRNSMILDRFGRPLKKLRASVTPRCNFRCFFCHREGITWEGEEMTSEDFEFVAEVLAPLGIKEVKLTGGEPLIRSDIVEIVRGMSKHMRVSLTTNGYFLKRFARDLRKAGLERVNVSLHGLDDESLRYVTRVNVSVETILDGIKEALKYMPVKVNVVLLSSNVKFVPRYIELAAEYGFSLQFIELLGNDYPQKVNPLEVEQVIARRARTSYVRRDMQNRIVYILDNEVRVEFVKPESASFCAGCTRIRLSHDGRFMPCLRLPIAIDALKEIRERDEEGLRKKLMQAVKARVPFIRPR